ncbi:hypothetical protein PAXRUDRAFT_40788, partial [Paxillus rubicundulus Ve08.2h10]
MSLPSSTQMLFLTVESCWWSSSAHLDSCYISSVEAAWHLFEFATHLEYQSVYRLPVHLEKEHNIVFSGEDAAEDVLEHAAARDTQFMGWFKAGVDEACITAGALNCLYQDFPKSFVWAKTK